MQHSSVRYRLLHGRPDLLESRMFGFKMFGRYILIIKYWTVFCVLFTGMRYVYVCILSYCIFSPQLSCVGLPNTLNTFLKCGFYLFFHFF